MTDRYSDPITGPAWHEDYYPYFDQARLLTRQILNDFTRDTPPGVFRCIAMTTGAPLEESMTSWGPSTPLAEFQEEPEKTWVEEKSYHRGPSNGAALYDEEIPDLSQSRQEPSILASPNAVADALQQCNLDESSPSDPANGSIWSDPNDTLVNEENESNLEHGPEKGKDAMPTAGDESVPAVSRHQAWVESSSDQDDLALSSKPATLGDFSSSAPPSVDNRYKKPETWPRIWRSEVKPPSSRQHWYNSQAPPGQSSYQPSVHANRAVEEEHLPQQSLPILLPSVYQRPRPLTSPDHSSTAARKTRVIDPSQFSLRQ